MPTLFVSADQDLGTARYRQTYSFAENGVASLRVLSPTDAHYTASIALELRILEFGQRLAHGRRAAKSAADGGAAAHTGRRLYDSALGAGAASLAQPMGGFEPGTRADLVVLDAGGRC